MSRFQGVNANGEPLSSFRVERIEEYGFKTVGPSSRVKSSLMSAISTSSCLGMRPLASCRTLTGRFRNGVM